MSRDAQSPPRYSDVDLEAARREVAAQLTNLVDELGIPQEGDVRRWENLLRDLCPGRLREIAAVVAAMQVGVLRDLAMAREGLPLRVVCRSASAKIEEHRGLNPDMAAWAVETWARALGLVPDGVAFAEATEGEPTATRSERRGKHLDFGPTRRIAEALEAQDTMTAIRLGIELMSAFPEDRLVRHLNAQLWSLHSFGRYLARCVLVASGCGLMIGALIGWPTLAIIACGVAGAVVGFILVTADEGVRLHRLLTLRTYGTLDAIAVGSSYWLDKALDFCARQWRRLSEGRTPGREE